MKIAVIGVGYVGLPTGIGFACYGHDVICIDKDINKIKALKESVFPIYEENLGYYYEKAQDMGNITFSDNLQDILGCQIIIICVGTPEDELGQADLSYIKAVANSLEINDGQLIAIKSTVPVGTNEIVKSIIQSNNKGKYFTQLSMPEFLREGFAFYDFFNPDRIVIGCDVFTEEITKTIYKLYPEHLHNKILMTDVKSAEMIKYASNSFLAMKIHYINQIADLCEIVGANVFEVAKGMGLDTRIGSKFLKPSIGYGGSCFPKDTKALYYYARAHKVDLSLIGDAIFGNYNRKKIIAQKILQFVSDKTDAKIAVLGLSFKKGTDDCRESASIDIINQIIQYKPNLNIRCYDKLAMDNAKEILKDKVCYCENIISAIQNVDLIVIMNDDEEFGNIETGITVFDFAAITNKASCPNRILIGVDNFNVKRKK